jgi:hypothetical protein
VDTIFELPVAFKVTFGNVNDVRAAPAALRQARWIDSKFHSEYVIADAGYSSEPFRRLARGEYEGIPVIKTNFVYKRALAAYPETGLWKSIHNRRISIDRYFLVSNATGS